MSLPSHKSSICPQFVIVGLLCCPKLPLKRCSYLPRWRPQYDVSTFKVKSRILRRHFCLRTRYFQVIFVLVCLFINGLACDGATKKENLLRFPGDWIFHNRKRCGGNIDGHHSLSLKIIKPILESRFYES